ncbi:ribulose-phosphate 3-epimerase [Niabella hibiscisoli]|uniref:ribulose-phosphate 3-epimerase n=1 Tax=Niabella hibiscisoli TaxID=1825928 RepID=UPI001F115D53|nr:ribulose-phosphate 3-epimerase [Niabella hibiscisoli]MCH5717363.1 ribulose-phosphate 3-epimerase [Niabella hibiscisoli]
MALIAPSLLAADFLKLQAECEMVNNSAADWLHLDVMDGMFVPNISFGPMVIEFVSKIVNKPCDVHLMIEQPARYAEQFKNAGADHLTIHIEACPMLHQDITQIKSLGMKAGVAVNPHTPVSLLSDILHEVSIVNLMSVNPGFGGQKFITYTLEKIKQLKQMIRERSLDVLIEIDGGVTTENAKEIIDAGADVLVAGSTVFRATDPIAAVEKLKSV